MSISSVKTGAIGDSLLAGNAAYQPTDFESISTVTVGSGGSSSITFSSIPSTYQHLQIRVLARSTAANVQSYVKLEFNGDTTGSNYYSHYIQADGSTVAAGANASLSAHYDIAGANATTSVFGAMIFDVLDYDDTNKFKTTRVLGGVDNNGSGRMNLTSGLWRSTSAVTSVTLTPASGNFAQYSSFALYGIKG